MTDVCTVDRVSVNSKFISKTCGAEVKILFAVESVVEPRKTSVSEKNGYMVSRLMKIYTVFRIISIGAISFEMFPNWFQFYLTTETVIPKKSVSIQEGAFRFQYVGVLSRLNSRVSQSKYRKKIYL